MSEMVKAVQVYAVDQGAKDTGNKEAKNISFTLKASGVDFADSTDKILEKALTEYVPNYNKIALKSKQWKEDPKATFEIDSDGGVKVTLSPDAFAEYSESKKETPKTNTP